MPVSPAIVIAVAVTVLIVLVVIAVATVAALGWRRRRDARAQAWAQRLHVDAQLDLLTAQTLAAMRDLARRSNGGRS